MSLFSATLFDGTTLANVRYRFYGSDGVASTAEQSSGIAQNASARPIFAISCTVPAGAFTMEIYDNSQAANWTVIPLNFARGDGVTDSAAALVKIQAAVYDSATVSGDTITLSNGTTIAKTAGNRVTT